jgi:HD-GYP domain-containing protein (c-di-GMP phosphodiesterase class II)
MDERTRSHSERIAHYSVRLATRLGLPETQVAAIRAGALLHEIGKLAISRSHDL